MSPLQRLTHAEVFEAPETETLKEYLQAGHGSFVGSSIGHMMII